MKLKYLFYSMVMLFSLIYYSRNYLQRLPPSICSMELHLLSVSNNKLTDLPKEIGQLKTLKSLVSNVIVFLMPIIIIILKIEVCLVKPNTVLLSFDTLSLQDISCNNLVYLPPSFTDLHSLVYLNIHRNEIKELPPGLLNVHHVMSLLSQLLSRHYQNSLKSPQCIIKYVDTPTYFSKAHELPQCIPL